MTNPIGAFAITGNSPGAFQAPAAASNSASGLGLLAFGMIGKIGG